MITKKEDLIGYYAAREDEEVFELFMQKCEEFGLTGFGGRPPRALLDTKEVFCSNIISFCDLSVSIELSNGIPANSKTKVYKLLTLDDFKYYKTRDKYTPVTKKDYVVLKEFHDGWEFYHSPKNSRRYSLVCNTQTLIQAHANKCLYTKEELNWRGVVKEYESISPNVRDWELYFDYRGQEETFIKMCHEVADITDRPEELS